MTFDEIKTFTWYESMTRPPFFVYKKTPPDDIDVIEFGDYLVGAWEMKGYNMKRDWDLRDSDFRPTRRYKMVLIRHIFKHSEWLRRS